MPATYGEIIDRVLANAGDTRAPNSTERARILVDLEAFAELDLRQMVGGPYLEGNIEQTIDGSSSTGTYDWDSKLRSVTGPLMFDSQQPWSRNSIFRDPNAFFRAFSNTTTTTGSPTSVLIYARTFVFRPVPDATSRVWKVYGTVYPEETVTEAAQVPYREWEPLLEHYATMRFASRKQMTETFQFHSAEFQRRLSLFRVGVNAGIQPARGWSGGL